MRGDLDEAMTRDLARGMSTWRARARYLKNLLGSSLSLAGARVGRRAPSWPGTGLSSLDVKLGWRALWKHPVLSAVSVLSLAVGIPLGLAPGYVFNALEAPLPIEEGERVVGLRYWSLERSSPAPTTGYDLTVWQGAMTSLEALAAVREVEQNLDPGTGVGQAVRGAEVTASAFAALRERPLLGRTLDPGDEQPGAPPVVVLGHDVWQAHLAGDPEVIGRTVRVAGVPHTIVGVMPATFLFPNRERMWLPLRRTEVAEPGAGSSILVFGRLADGSTDDGAQAELTAVAQRMALDHPEVYGSLRAEIVPFAVAAGGWPRGGLRARPQARLIQVPALILLLVACLNVGLLVLAQAATRSSEIVVRTALGASRSRIVAQVFTEALVLSVLAAGLGVLVLTGLTERLVDAGRTSGWARVPYWVDPSLSIGTVGWALVLSIVSAGVASVLPALRVTRKGAAGNLHRVASTGSGVRFGGQASALVVIDLAVAVAVMGAVVGIGDRLRGALTRDGQLGVAAERYLAAEVRLPQGNGPKVGEADEDESRAARLAALERTLVERLEAEPGVESIAVGSAFPGTNHSRRFVEVEGRVDAIDQARVRPGFFEAFDRPVIMGRALRPADLDGDRRAVVVNLAFQEEVLAGRNPLGLLLRYPTSGESSPSYQIVGLAPDLGADPLNPSGGAAVYHAVGPGELGMLRMAIRIGPDPTSFTPRLRTLLGEIDPTAILEEPTSLDQVTLEATGVVVGATASLALLASILLALAASGIYALMSHAVAQRTREIGIRAALGARPERIAATIARRAVVHLATGALLGMPLAGWLYVLVREDPGIARSAVATAATLPGIGVVLLVGLLACTAPVVRALRVMPTEAIRRDGRSSR